MCRRGKLWPADVENETRAIELMAYVTGTIHGQGFARIFATATFARDPADHPAVQAQGREIVERCFAILNDAMAGKTYAAGEFSVANPILFYVEFWADKTGIALPENLAAHYERLLARTAVRQVLREEGYDPARLGASRPAASRAKG